MNRKLFNVLLFATGAAVGSLVTWKVMTIKREQIIQEEIDSFKETYALCMGGKNNEPHDDSDELDESDDEEDPFDEDDSEMIDYAKLASRYGQPSGEDAETDEKGEGNDEDEVSYINGPYIIEPKDFADGNFDHDCHCISYYADGVLADDWGVKLDIEETIGEEALDHFGDFAEDVIHVRNERLKADYEVAKDPRKYSDVIARDIPTHMYAD